MLASNALTTIIKVRRSLGFEDDSKDEFIIETVNTASQIIERYCNRKFKRQEYTDIALMESDEYLFSQYPVHQVIAIGDRPLESLKADLESGILFHRVSAHQTIRYIAGYDLPNSEAYMNSSHPLPPDVEKACLKLVQQLYEDDEMVAAADMGLLKTVDMGDMKVQLQSGNMAAIPMDVAQLLVSHRKMNL